MARSSPLGAGAGCGGDETTSRPEAPKKGRADPFKPSDSIEPHRTTPFLKRCHRGIRAIARSISRRVGLGRAHAVGEGHDLVPAVGRGMETTVEGVSRFL